MNSEIIPKQLNKLTKDSEIIPKQLNKLTKQLNIRLTKGFSLLNTEVTAALLFLVEEVLRADWSISGTSIPHGFSRVPSTSSCRTTNTRNMIGP